MRTGIPCRTVPRRKYPEAFFEFLRWAQAFADFEALVSARAEILRQEIAKENEQRRIWTEQYHEAVKYR